MAAGVYQGAGNVRVIQAQRGPMGPSGGVSRVVAIDARSYTLQPSDANSVLVFTATASVQVYVPAGLPDLFAVSLIKAAAGNVYVRSQGAEVVGPTDFLGLDVVYACAELLPIGLDSYALRGGTVAPPPLDSAPSGLLLTPDVVVASASPDTLIGQLVADAEGALQPLTYVLPDDLGGRVALIGDQLFSGPALSSADAGSTLQVSVQVTDADQNSFTATVPVFVIAAGVLDFSLPSQSGLLLLMVI